MLPARAGARGFVSFVLSWARPGRCDYARAMSVWKGAVSVLVMACAMSCSSDRQTPAQNPQPYPGQGYPQQPGVAPGQPGFGQPGVQQPGQPGFGQPVQPGVGQPGTAFDPIAAQQLSFLRQQAQNVLGELVAALPPAKQQRVAGIPLVVDDTPGDVNAFAACSDQGKSAMAITDGLLQIEAVLALAQAHDEVYGTRAVDAYIQTLATQLRPGQPIPQAPAGLFPGAADPRVVAREAQLFDEQLAFVMGHELGHHHLGHLPCTATADPLGAGEVARVLSGTVPLFNQPNEIAADLAGTYNVLDAARNRAARGGYAWTEGGGLLTMRFFSGLDQLSPATVLTSFESSHPPPQLRVPIIQQAANTWRSTGGAPFPMLGF